MNTAQYDRLANAVLALLYDKHYSTAGFSTASARFLASETCYARCCVQGALDRLAAAGEIVIAPPFIILTRWRYRCRLANPFSDSPRAVPRHAAKHALKLWPKMPPRAREAYLASCGLTDVDELKRIVETKVGRCA